MPSFNGFGFGRNEPYPPPGYLRFIADDIADFGREVRFRFFPPDPNQVELRQRYGYDATFYAQVLWITCLFGIPLWFNFFTPSEQKIMREFPSNVTNAVFQQPVKKPPAKK